MRLKISSGMDGITVLVRVVEDVGQVRHRDFSEHTGLLRLALVPSVGQCRGSRK